ncbi:MAG: LCP family protein [Clostridia bacterium]|nr:LCP family protein [Clostridia bacterium]
MTPEEHDPILWLNDEPEQPEQAEDTLPELPETNRRARAKKKPSKVAGWKIAVSAIMTVLGVAVICVAVLLQSAAGLLDAPTYVNQDDDPVDPSVIEKDEVPDYTPEDLSTLEVRGNNEYVTNYLLVGCDARRSGRGLADTNIILSINDATKTIKMVSIMRDTWVTLPDSGYQTKINAAYSYGGFEGLLGTVESTFCLDIDQAIRVDFTAFQSAIDALGGVDIFVDARAARCIPKVDPGDPDIWAVKSGERDDWYTLIREPIGTTEGVYHLEGFQALGFARLRKIYPDSDYTRTQNQRRLLATLIETAKANPSKIFGALGAVLQKVTLYRITKGDILDYVYNVSDYMDYTIESDFTLQYRNSTSSGGASILLLTDHENQVKQLHEYLYATQREEPKTEE